MEGVIVSNVKEIPDLSFDRSSFKDHNVASERKRALAGTHNSEI